MSDIEQPKNLRSRTRERLRQEVAGLALELFIQRGFEEVTAEEIARASGICSRSFFRYFPTKEDAALAGLETSTELVAAAFMKRPADETVWESLEHAFATLIEAPALQGLSPLEVSRLFVHTPSLRARRSQKHQEWRSVMLPLLTQRLPTPQNPALADVVGPSLLAAALGCLDTATEMWVRHEGDVPATEVLSETFKAITSSTHQTTPDHH